MSRIDERPNSITCVYDPTANEPRTQITVYKNNGHTTVEVQCRNHDRTEVVTNGGEVVTYMPRDIAYEIGVCFQDLLRAGRL